MDDEKKLQSPEVTEGEENLKDSEEKTPELPKGDLERFYENFRSVPLKYVDRFIICCFLLLIAVVAFGVLKARF